MDLPNLWQGTSVSSMSLSCIFPNDSVSPPLLSFDIPESRALLMEDPYFSSPPTIAAEEAPDIHFLDPSYISLIYF